MTLVTGSWDSSHMHARAHRRIDSRAKEGTKDCFHPTADCVILRNSGQPSAFCHQCHFLHLVHHRSYIVNNEKEKLCEGLEGFFAHLIILLYALHFMMFT